MHQLSVGVLIVNVLWFGMAFRFFGLQPRRAIKILTPESARHDVSREAFIAGLRFLGGMNLGFSVLSAAALGALLLGGPAPSLWLVFLASAVAHASQWAFNLPHAVRGGRSSGAPWDVLRGPMAFIFAVDAACALANAALSLL